MDSSVIELDSLSEVLAPDMESVVADVFARGWLEGLAIGLLKGRTSFVRFPGGAGVDADSQFQVGSVTKTYTAQLLALMDAAGEVSMHDPVARYLKPGSPAGSGTPITLLDLATHSSGLPNYPPLFPIFDRNPFAHYSRKRLDAYIRSHTLTRPAASLYKYSNFGFILLGAALAAAASTDFATLVRTRLLEPAHMQRSEFTLTGVPHRPLLQGRTQAGLTTPPWTFDVCAPCGGLQSSVTDQLKWLRWVGSQSPNPALERHGAYRVGTRGKTVTGGMGLGWHLERNDTLAWHNGATYGFSSYVSIDPTREHGVVVLSNRLAPVLTMLLGRKLEACLRGDPIRPLSGDYGLTAARVLDPVRLVLRPVVYPLYVLPAWLRIPAAGGLVYGAQRAWEWAEVAVRHH